jgi:hypothetical protein
MSRATITDLDGKSVKLRLQGLSGPMQCLAISGLAASMAQHGAFTTRQVADLFVTFRLPSSSNLSATLGRLRDSELLMRPSKDTWALTPFGQQRLDELTPQVPALALASALEDLPGSEFGERHHSLIPPFLGPTGSAPGLSRLLGHAPFEQNIMLVARFPHRSGDHFTDLIPKLREAVRAHGLNLHVASDGMAADTLWANVVTYMWACKYAIVLMDSLDGKLNCNVLIEIGGMLMTGRRCAILHDLKAPDLPSDLVGHINKPTDLTDHAEAARHIHRWIRDDLRLGNCPTCPPPA